MSQEFNFREKFTIKGEWWLPDREDDKVAGILTYEPGSRIELELIGAFTKEGGYEFFTDYADNCPIIFGVSLKCECITLFDAVRQNFSSTTNNRSGLAWDKATYACNSLLINEHFPTLENVSFAQARLDFTHLDLWLPFPQLNDESGPDDWFKFECDVPALNAKLLMGTNIASQTDYHKGEKLIKRGAYIVIQPLEKQDLEWFVKVIQKLQNLMSFCMGAPLYHKYIKLNLDGEDVSPEKRRDVWYINVEHLGKRREKFTFQDALFPFHEIQGEFENIVQSWFQQYEKYRFLVNLYRGYQYGHLSLLESQFISLMQALEGFFRLNQEEYYGTRIKEEDFTAIKTILYNAIPATTPPDLKGSLKTGIGYANEYGLSEKIHKLIEDIPENEREKLFKRDVKVFVKEIKDTRNFWSHLSDNDNKVLYTWDLLEANLRIWMLLTFLLCKKLSFSEALTLKCLYKSRHYRELCHYVKQKVQTEPLPE